MLQMLPVFFEDEVLFMFIMALTTCQESKVARRLEKKDADSRYKLTRTEP